MIVEIVDNLGRSLPVRVPASQVIVYTDQMTPVMIAGEYGPAGVLRLSHLHDADFAQTLQSFGVGRHQLNITSIRTTPPPSGARLINGPGALVTG